MGANDPKIVGRAHPRRSRLSLDGWPLRWKVAATLVVPMALAATIGAVRIQGELSDASKLSVAAGNTAIVAPAVEFVDRLDALAAASASAAPVADPIAQFDASATALAALIRSTEFDTAVTAELASATATAKTVRDEIAAGAPPSPLVADRTDSVSSAVASAVATSTAAVDDTSVRPLADQLTAVLAAQRALTTQQILVATPDFANSVELRARAAEAAGAEAAAIGQLDRLTPDADTVTLRGQSDIRRAAYTLPLGEVVASTDMANSIQASANRYRVMAQQLAAELESTVQSRAIALRSAALRDTAIILGAVLAALVFALGVGRSLVTSIGRLRRGALQVARVQLPDEIEQLSKGAAVPRIEALPVDTDEEVGQLARAIDDIHLQAVRLAEEHGVRLQIGDMFETLSRRSRSLVEEQLVLIETLEHDEDDPARLDHLFRLDHLATRMRRNGDNLLVLADTVERHRRLEPVPVAEMLRAAISEVEDYRRVSLGAVAEGSIAGAAAADIGHMLAELLDNALQYSPPDAPVWVTVSRAVDAGLLVEISDRGLGMPAEDVREANERLALGGEVTSDTAKRMGLFVVGRLARRHGATVTLRTSTGTSGQPGVTASVHLPGALLALGPADTTADPTPIERLNGAERRRAIAAVPPVSVVPEPAPAPSAPSEPAVTGGGLPMRSPGASGVPGAEAPPPPPSRDPVWPKPEYEDGSIYARMTSEWMTTPEPTPPAAEEPETPMPRQTRSGLPIRDRGARMIPEAPDAADGNARPSETRNDPEAIRNTLSRQLTGVRRGRAETDEPRGEGDR
jgi:signal transduction histidine kinase